MKRETALRRRSSIIRLQKVSIFFPINFDQLIPSYPAKIGLWKEQENVEVDVDVEAIHTEVFFSSISWG